MRYRFRWFLLLLGLVALLLFVNSTLFARWAYPVYFEQEIQQAAVRYGVDPYLVAAVVRTESRFQQSSLSHKGAVGLMQIMPETGIWALREMGLSPSAIRYLTDPSLNIEIGTWYLSWLLEKYEGNLVASLAAYNAGQGKVDEWQQEGVWDMRLENLERIPYGETRRYVRMVLHYHDRYQSVYRGKLFTLDDLAYSLVYATKMKLCYTI